MKKKFSPTRALALAMHIFSLELDTYANRVARVNMEYPTSVNKLSQKKRRQRARWA